LEFGKRSTILKKAVLESKEGFRQRGEFLRGFDGGSRMEKPLKGEQGGD